MLKLERVRQDFIIRIRERDRLLTPLFWQALGMALAVHIGAFLIFHIQPFKADSSFIFPPVYLDTQGKQTPFNQEVSSQTQTVPLLADLPSIPPSLEVKLPQIPLGTSLFLEDEPQATFNLLSNQTVLIDPVAFSFTHPFWPTAYSPVHLHVSGELANRSILSADPLFSKRLVKEETDELSSYLVKYHVQVNEQTGTIFWYDKKQSSGIQKIDKRAESLLLSLQFSPHKGRSLDSIDGEIELTITGTP